MRRVLCVALAVFMIAGMVARSAAGEKVTLNFAVFKTFNEDPIRILLDQYQKENPIVTINVIQLPTSNNGTEIHQWLVTNLSAMTGDVDVVSADCIWFPEFASAGWLLDVGKYFTDKEKSQFFNGAIDTVSYQGNMFGVPWFIDGGLLFYRDDLLKKHGVQPPKTWDDLIAASEKILKAENNPKLNGFIFQAKQAEVLICDLVEFLGSQGAVLDAKGKPVINNEYGKRVAKLMHDLIFKYKISPREVNTFDEEPSRVVFTDGNALFHRNWTYVWGVSQNPEQSSVVGKVGYMPMPVFSGAGSASCLGGWQWGISKASKHPEEAVKLAKFLSSYESQKFLAIKHSLIPTMPAVFADAELIAKNPYLSSLKDVFLGATPRPGTPLYPEVSLALQASFSKICSTENIDVDKELDALAAEIGNITAMLE